jgi:t-SNARE complex subunit (syntaxin)
MDKNALIQRGDAQQIEALDRITKSRTIVEQTKEVAGNVEMELQRQDEVIDHIQDDVEDIKTDLKRSAKLLGQMLRRYATDKIIIAIIIIIGIVILFLIIYGAAGLDENDDFNTPDDDV